MAQHDLLPHLFRTEFRKITVVLARQFGLAHVEVAEDIASDTFLQAMETWSYQGLPANPTAWLYSVARNKARNRLNRDTVFRDKVLSTLSETASEEPNFDEHAVFDGQLQMMFAICHSAIPRESQIGLALRILCGLGIDELATAFLTNRETINKRLYRARETLRTENIPLAMPPAGELPRRLEAVLHVLYLLFSEGYYSESQDMVLREDVCQEALMLTRMLLKKEETDVPATRALLALMCFHASRFPARKDAWGDLIVYPLQDASRWDQALISEGVRLLHDASVGDTFTRYHLEATIAYWHTRQEDTMEKWQAIVKLYDHLIDMEYSPVVALNRAFAISKLEGAEVAIPLVRSLKLERNPFYFVVLGELHVESDKQLARRYFGQALSLIRTRADRRIVEQRMDSLTN